MAKYLLVFPRSMATRTVPPQSHAQLTERYSVWTRVEWQGPRVVRRVRPGWGRDAPEEQRRPAIKQNNPAADQRTELARDSAGIGREHRARLAGRGVRRRRFRPLRVSGVDQVGRRHRGILRARERASGTRGPGSKPPGTPCQLRYPAFTGMKLPFAAAIFGSITVRTPSLNAAVVFSVSTGPGSGTVRVNAPHARSAR
jgi:hypothetical protein